MPKLALYILFIAICIVPLLNCPVLPYTGNKDKSTPAPPLPTSVPGATPHAIWADRFGGGQEDAGCAISVDADNGKIAVVGNIGAEAEKNAIIKVFDGTVTTSSLLWEKTLGGDKADYALGVACGGGFVAVTGSVIGPADLDGDGSMAGHDGEDATGYDKSDIFVSVFTESGAYAWSKRLGGLEGDAGNSIALLGNPPTYVAVTGYVTGDADLKGNGTMESHGFGQADIFISVFSLTTGDFQSSRSKRFGGSADDLGYGIAYYGTDKTAIVVTGFVLNTADLDADGIAGNAEGETAKSWQSGKDAFIAAFDKSGLSLFTKRLGGSQEDWGQSVATNGARIAVTGTIYGTADIDGDPSNLAESPGTGTADAFISVFDSGSFKWSKRLGGNGTDNGCGISVAPKGEVIVCGAVTGAADLNGNTADGIESSGYGASDVFVSSFDSAGKYLFSGTFGGSGSDMGYGVFAGNYDNRIYLTGSVTGLADLNADGDTNDAGESPAYGLSDLFISVLEW